jgi:hypothetical protein
MDYVDTRTPQSTTQQQTRALELKCRHYEATLAALERQQQRDGYDSSNQRALLDATRRLAELEVSSANVQRAHTLILQDHAMTRRDLQQMDHDWLEKERTLKYRVLYFESWKAGAEDTIERMESTLARCVLRSIYERQQQALHALERTHARVKSEYVELHAQYLTVSSSGGSGGSAAAAAAAMIITPRELARLRVMPPCWSRSGSRTHRWSTPSCRIASRSWSGWSNRRR